MRRGFISLCGQTGENTVRHRAGSPWALGKYTLEPPRESSPPCCEHFSQSAWETTIRVSKKGCIKLGLFLGFWILVSSEITSLSIRRPGQQQPPEPWPQPERPDCRPPSPSQELELWRRQRWDLGRLWGPRQQLPSEVGAQHEEAGGRRCAGLFGGHLGEGHLGGGRHCCWFCWQDILAGVQ